MTIETYNQICILDPRESVSMFVKVLVPRKGSFDLGYSAFRISVKQNRYFSGYICNGKNKRQSVLGGST